SEKKWTWFSEFFQIVTIPGARYKQRRSRPDSHVAPKCWARVGRAVSAAVTRRGHTLRRCNQGSISARSRLKEVAILLRYPSTLLALSPAARALGQEVVSGPDRGSKVPTLKVFDATGPAQGKDVDYATERKGKPTIYVFIQADKWDRPMARFLKELD